MQAPLRVTNALEQLKDIFREAPDLHLSTDDAARKLGVEQHLCDALLSALADVRYLVREGNEYYSAPRALAEGPDLTSRS